MNLGAVLLYVFAFYAVVGLCVAVAFVSIGATCVLGTQTSVTIGARVLIFPGAAALWPYVLFRWCKSGTTS